MPKKSTSADADVAVLKQIEQQKQVLEQLANIVYAINRLTTSLENLLYMTGSSEKLAQMTFQFTEYLDDKQRKLATSKIEIRLEALDNKIRDELSHILDSINKSTDDWPDSHSDDPAGNPFAIVGEFRRKVQLAVAYRLLIAERGVEVQPIDLDIAPDLISNSLAALKKNESHFRKQLMFELNEMIEKIIAAERDSAVSEGMAFLLSTAKDTIAKQIRMIKSGKPIESLEQSYDILTMEVEKQEKKPAPKATAKAKAEKRTAPTAPQQSIQKSGFFKTFNAWLSTPSGVSWSEVKNQQNPNKKK